MSRNEQDICRECAIGWEHTVLDEWECENNLTPSSPECVKWNQKRLDEIRKDMCSAIKELKELKLTDDEGYFDTNFLHGINELAELGRIYEGQEAFNTNFTELEAPNLGLQEVNNG